MQCIAPISVSAVLFYSLSHLLFIVQSHRIAAILGPNQQFPVHCTKEPEILQELLAILQLSPLSSCRLGFHAAVVVVVVVVEMDDKPWHPLANRSIGQTWSKPNLLYHHRSEWLRNLLQPLLNNVEYEDLRPFNSNHCLPAF